MKVLAIAFILLKSALGFCQEADFSFTKTTHKFKKTNEGEILSHYFVFKNSGSAPLVITDYKVACHCTKIEFPDYPVLPGKTDSLKLTFNTNGKYYQQDRDIKLISNAKNKETYLRFKVYVIPKDDE